MNNNDNTATEITNSSFSRIMADLDAHTASYVDLFALYPEFLELVEFGPMLKFELRLLRVGDLWIALALDAEERRWDELVEQDFARCFTSLAEAEATLASWRQEWYAQWVA